MNDKLKILALVLTGCMSLCFWPSIWYLYTGNIIPLALVVAFTIVGTGATYIAQRGV